MEMTGLLYLNLSDYICQGGAQTIPRYTATMAILLISAVFWEKQKTTEALLTARMCLDIIVVKKMLSTTRAGGAVWSTSADMWKTESWS